MKSVFRILVLGIVLCSTSLYASDSGKVTGRVFDADDSNLLYGAGVYFYDSGRVLLDSANTGSKGTFAINLTAGTYYVSAGKGNYITEYFPDSYILDEADKVRVYTGQNVSIDFDLDRGGWIGGTFDYDGGDSGWGLVTAIKIDQPYSGWHKSVAIDGSFPKHYVLGGLIPGTYRILGQVTGGLTIYYPGVTDPEDAELVRVFRNEGIPEISFFMEPAGSGYVSGRAFDAQSGAGISGIQIMAYQMRDYSQDPNLRSTTTDIDGNFELGLSAGDYYMCARCDGCMICSGDITIYYNNQYDPALAEIIEIPSNGSAEGIDFGFDFSNIYDLSISGTIIDEQNGQGLGGVGISAIDYNSGRIISSAVSRSEGEFSIENLISGEYIVMFSDMNVIPYFYRNCQTWQDAQIINLTTDFRGIQTEAITQDYGNMGLAISGRVIANTGPLSGARVYAYLGSDENPIAYAVSGASGEYTIIRGLVPGTYRVVCDIFGYNSQTYPSLINLDLYQSPEAQNIDFLLDQPTTGILEPTIEIPDKIEVSGNYPNPFNADTKIEIYSGYSNMISTNISVYNILGGKVGERAVVLKPGVNYIVWGENSFNRRVSSGVYFYRVDGADGVHRMLLLK